MGESSSSSTEQSQNMFPQYTQDAKADLLSTGTGMMEQFLRNPQYAVAGQTTDQLKGYDLARDTAREAYTAPQITVPGSSNLTASMGTAAQVTPGAIKGGMNPFLDTVGNTTLDSMRKEYLNADAGLAAKYAGSGMGGSGEAIARGQAARGYNENVASTIAQLQAQGYDKATALALANAQMQQQTGLANQSAENAMRATGADYGIKSAQVQDALRTSQQAREMAGMQQLLQNGGAQQQFGQQVTNVPLTMLGLLQGLTPQQLNSMKYGTKETESEKAPIDTISTGITALTGLKGLFGGCDRSMKTDIEEVGIDPESGLTFYAFRYIGDPKSYPKVVAPMSDEVEAIYPGATRVIAGKRVLILGALPVKKVA